MIRNFIPYTHQNIDNNDIEAVVKVLKSDWLTTGPTVAKFEYDFSNYVGSKYSIAVSSATAGLDLSILSLDLPQNSEIITTPFTFVATSNSILYNNCKPIFVDIDPKTYNIDPKKIEEKITKKTKAILPVHYAGQPCDMDAINEIAEKHNLKVIEDAAHAIGAEYKGKKIGNVSDLTIFSLHAAKNITTGEGGVITTNNKELYEKLILLRSHGIDKSPLERHEKNSYIYDMKFLGKNYRLTDFQCALGITQLKKVDSLLEKRNKIIDAYNKEFKNLDIQTQFVNKNLKHAWHLYTILLNNVDRDSFFNEMRNSNIGVNVHYIPVYHHTYYKKTFNLNSNNFPVTEDVFKRIVTLPLFPDMTDSDVNFVIKTTKETIEKLS